MTSEMTTCQFNSQSFTTYGICPLFILEHGVSAMKPFAGSHTNIANELNAERWNISHSKIHLLVQDSPANMTKGVRDAVCDSAKYFINSLPRAVE